MQKALGVIFAHVRRRYEAIGCCMSRSNTGAPFVELKNKGARKIGYCNGQDRSRDFSLSISMDGFYCTKYTTTSGQQSTRPLEAVKNNMGAISPATGRSIVHQRSISGAPSCCYTVQTAA